MNHKTYSGVVVPMVTPVTADGHIDTEATARIIQLFATHGVSPLLLGTTGEGQSVGQADARELVATASRTAAGRITVYAGLTGTCVAEQRHQCEAFAQAGADVIVATLPSYYALTPAQMERYYTDLAEGSPRPVMLYNILATTHMSIPLDVVARLADHPNVVGLKDSERDPERMERCIDLARGRADFSYFCGWAAQSARSLALGGDGIVPSTGNFAPGMFAELYAAATAGDAAGAERLQQETDAIARLYQAGRTLGESLAALKVMMATDGLCAPHMLPPLTRLTPEAEAAVAEAARRVSHR